MENLRRMMLLALLAGLLSPPAAAQCPSTSDTILEYADLGAQALQHVDEETLQRAIHDLMEALSCMEEPLTADAAVAYHQTMALWAFYNSNYDAIAPTFQAILTIDPLYRLPGAFQGYRFPEDLEAARSLPTTTLRPMWPPHGYLALVDSQPREELPGDRAAILQWVEQDAGAVHSTYYLYPGDPIPVPPALDQGSPPPPPKHAPDRRRRLAWAAGGAALSSGLLWTSALLLERSYFSAEALSPYTAAGALTEDSESWDTLSARRGLVNGLAAGGGVSGALALGVGVALVVSR